MFFDSLLVVCKPGEVTVKMILMVGIETQKVARRVALGKTHSAESRPLIDESGQNLPQSKPAITTLAQGLGKPYAFGDCPQTHPGTDPHPLAGMNVLNGT